MMRFWFRGGLVLLLGSLAACSSDKVQAPRPLVDIPRHAPSSVWFAERWEHKVGDGDGGEFLRLRPAMAGNAVFVASRDGHIRAYDKADGHLLWSRWTRFPFTGALSAGYGMVYAGTNKGQLVVLDAATGKTRWWIGDLSAAVLSTPVADANTVVVMCGDGKVYAYGRESAQRLWVHDTQVPALSLRGNATPVIANGSVYIATATGKIEAVQVADGLPQWDVRVASNLGRSDLDRITDVDGDMLVDDASDVLYAAGFQSQLSAVDLSDGHRLWQYDLSSYDGLASAAGNIFVADADGVVYAIDARSGKAVWRQPDLEHRRLGSPLVFGDDVLVGDDDGYVHVLAQADGSLVGRFRQDSAPVLALGADDGSVYVYSADGHFGVWQHSANPPPLKRLVRHGMNPWGQDLDTP